MLRRAGVLCLIIWGLGVAAQGQMINGMAGAMAPPVTVHLGGTVSGVAQGLVGLTTDDGAIWRLSVTARSEVHIRGKASPDLLTPNTYVRFTAPVETRRGTIQGQVDKLTIFSPSQDTLRIPGVVIAGQEEERAAEEGILVGGQAAPTRRPSNRQNQTLPEIETFEIRGRLTSIRGKTLTVLAENNFFRSTLRFELADTVEVDLDVNTYLLAAIGDPITADVVPMGMVPAGEVVKLSIDLSQVVGEQQQPAARAGDRRGTRLMGQADGARPVAGAVPQPAAADQSAGDTVTRLTPQQMVQFLKPSAQEAKGKPPVSLRLGPGDAKKFEPCKQVSAKAELAKKFGEPDQIQPVAGSLALGEQGELTKVRWQLWAYGAVLVFVDEAGKTRYIHAADP